MVFSLVPMVQMSGLHTHDPLPVPLSRLEHPSGSDLFDAAFAGLKSLEAKDPFYLVFAACIFRVGSPKEDLLKS